MIKLSIKIKYRQCNVTKNANKCHCLILKNNHKEEAQDASFRENELHNQNEFENLDDCMVGRLTLFPFISSPSNATLIDFKELYETDEILEEVNETAKTGMICNMRRNKRNKSKA